MNDTIKITSFLIVFFLLITIAFQYGCKSAPTGYETPYKVPKDKYLFLEHQVILDGAIVEGEYFGPLAESRVTYSFDSTQGTLYGLIDFPIIDSLVGIYGGRDRLSGVAGTGAVAKIFGVFRLPYKRDVVILSSINADESISMKYKDSVFVLPKGHESETVTSRLDTLGTAVVLFTTTERITNYGLQLKSNIQKWPE